MGTGGNGSAGRGFPRIQSLPCRHVYEIQEDTHAGIELSRG